MKLHRRAVSLTEAQGAAALAVGPWSMTRVTFEEARDTLPLLAERVARERVPVLLTQGRKQVVALVSADVLERLEEDAAEDAEPLTAADLGAVRRGRSAISRGDFMTLDQLDADAR
jgi:PHD/YefM family antitoxin component YafN of YafNO toxin-antitoxin module